MIQYVKRTQCDYSLSFKLAVVEQVEKGEVTCRQATDRYGIQGNATVMNWLRKYGQLDWLSSPAIKKRGARGDPPSPPVIVYAAPRPVWPLPCPVFRQIGRQHSSPQPPLPRPSIEHRSPA